MGIFDTLLKIGAPIAGFALGGPVGAGIGASVAGGISGAQAQGKADKMSQQALAMKQQQYAEMAPARSRLAAMLQGNSLTPQRPDLSGIFADQGNPYARPVSRLASSLPPMPQAPQQMGSPGIAPGMMLANRKGMRLK